MLYYFRQSRSEPCRVPSTESKIAARCCCTYHRFTSLCFAFFSISLFAHLPYSTGFASQFTIAYTHTHSQAPNRWTSGHYIHVVGILHFTFCMGFYTLHWLWHVHSSIWTLERWIVFVYIIRQRRTVDRELHSVQFSKLENIEFGVHGNRTPKIAIKCNEDPYLMLLFLLYLHYDRHNIISSCSQVPYSCLFGGISSPGIFFPLIYQHKLN